MQFTPGQVKEVLGISEETLRYWRRVLPGFAGRKGYAPCFGFHDVVCLRLVKDICGILGVQVSKMIPAFPDLRSIVTQSIVSEPEVWFLSFDPATESVGKLRAEELAEAIDRPVAIIPGSALMAEVRSKLLGVEDIKQPSLPFPLIGLPGIRRG